MISQRKDYIHLIFLHSFLVGSCVCLLVRRITFDFVVDDWLTSLCAYAMLSKAAKK